MLRASDDSGLKDADVSQMSQEQILIKIEQLQLTSRSLLDELQRQNEYDRSRGITPGKFREHFTIGSIEANKVEIDSLKKELSRRETAELWKMKMKSDTVEERKVSIWEYLSSSLRFFNGISWSSKKKSNVRGAKTKGNKARPSSISTLPQNPKHFGFGDDDDFFY